MKIATFNVNSLRARLAIVVDWLLEHRPDILCVQETKVQDKDFPCDAFDEIDYKYVFKGQKSYNGVALFSREEIEEVRYGFEDEPKDGPRLITGQIKGVRIVNTYVPQGQSRESEKFQYKLNWFKRLGEFFEENFEPGEPIIWVGDFNVAPEDRDVYDPDGLRGHVCFCEEVTEALNGIMEWGFVDLFRKYCQEAGQYTFWDYRERGGFRRNHGWRLDHIMVSKSLAKKSTGCYVDKKPRMLEKPSDHTPLVAEFEL